MMINAPEDWKLPESEQAPDKPPTSTRQVSDKLHTDNLNIVNLVREVGERERNKLTQSHCERVYALYDAISWWHEYVKESILDESD